MVVLLLITLWSLSAIFFTRLFYRKRMFVAAVASTGLFLYVIGWFFSILILDMVDLGLPMEVTRETLVFGSDIYRSLTDFSQAMYTMPTELLLAIVMMGVLTIVISISVVFFGSYLVLREFIRFLKSERLRRRASRPVAKTRREPYRTAPYFRLYCRANC